MALSNTSTTGVTHLPSGIFRNFPQWQFMKLAMRSRIVFDNHKQQLLLGLAICIFSILTVQFAYPSHRMLPYSKLAGQNIGLKDFTGIQSTLNSISNSDLTVQSDFKTYHTNPNELGITYSADKSITNYPFSARIIPFSILFYGRNQDYKSHVSSSINHSKAIQFADKVIQENTKSAVEGSIKLEQTQVLVTSPVAGATYIQKDILKTLSSIKLNTTNIMLPASKSLPPKFNSSAYEVAATQAKKHLSKRLQVNAVGKQLNIEPSTIASWMSFSPDTSSGQIHVEFNADAVKNSLKDLAQQVYIAPTTTRITTLDGIETERVSGVPGRALTQEATATAIISAVQSEKPIVEGLVHVLAAPIQTNRTYSNTSHGLQTLLNDWVNANRGPRWAIVIKELDNQGRYAAVRPDEIFITASTYKLFLAYPVLSRIADGSLDPNTVTSTGDTIDVCIDRMIVISSNPCGHMFGEMLGWANATSQLNSKGFYNTNLTNLTTTAGDATRILEQLYSGVLLPPTQNNRLLDMMMRQIYRNGIPAGSRGIVVANKVGYVDGYRHDVGIVYHPKGVYTLSIYSYGGSYSAIADLARTISNYMNQ